MLGSPIGTCDFETVRRSGLVYVDKTALIREVLSGARTLLVPRPRRFGKTLNLTMLHSFFDRSLDSRGLFEGLEVSRDPETMAHLNAYPTIFITFKEVTARNWHDCQNKLSRLVSEAIDPHFETLNLKKLSPAKRGDLEAAYHLNSETVTLESALKTLIEGLYKSTGKKVILLIDEYDTPLHEGQNHGYYPEIVSFFRGFLGGALKGNPFLERAVVTGILRVGKESIYSGLNNLSVYSVLDEKFSTYFGFTEAEVQQLLGENQSPHPLEEVREWFNGYRIGSHTLYNPWSILKMLEQGSAGLTAYWIGTSGNELIVDLIQEHQAIKPEQIETLLRGETLPCKIQNSVAMANIDESSVWTLLLYSGYLTAHRWDSETSIADLRLPNLEVRSFFEDSVMRWLGSQSEVNQLVTSLLELRLGDFATYLAHAVKTTLSFIDVGGREPEKTYHVFIAGLLASLQGRYKVGSNAEVGFGRPDLELWPKKRGLPGFIFEFKQTHQTNLTKAANEALAQIEQQEYATNLHEAGLKHIALIGIAFSGKRIMLASRIIERDGPPDPEINHYSGEQEPQEAPQQSGHPKATGLFVGREKELAALDKGLSSGHQPIIYLLVGPGGIGKTTLAREAARQFGDRFETVIEIQAADQTPQEFALTLAKLLGEPIDEPRDAREARSQITRLLKDHKVLLLLDNLTNVPQAADFLPEGSPSRFVITTRENRLDAFLRQQRADLQVEQLSLGLFTPEETQTLFQEVLSRSYQSEQAESYHQIGETLGYLPVALRLALNWMVFPPQLSASELLERLQTNKLAVVEKDPGRDPELRTLTAVFELGDSLTHAQRKTLNHLAVCAEGPVPLSFLSRFEAEPEDSLREDLELLVAQSWCTAQVTAEERYYELHVLVRALLRQKNQDPTLIQKFLELLHHVYNNEQVHFHIKDRWLTQFVEALSQWSTQFDPNISDLVSGAFFQFCQRRGQGALYLRLAELVRAKSSQDKKLWATTFLHEAMILEQWVRLEEAFALHQKAEAKYEALGDRSGLAHTYGGQARILTDWGKLEEALILLKQEECIWEALGNRTGLAQTFVNQALVLEQWGKREEAVALQKKAESLYEALGDRAGLAQTYGGQARILTDWGKLEEALNLLKQEECIWEALGNRAGLAMCWWNQGRLFEIQGDLMQALSLLQKALATRQEMGIPTAKIEAELEVLELRTLETN